jgi:hypothetical protein
MKDMFEILSDIADERARQDTKWGVQNHPFSNETITDISSVLVESFKQTCEATAKSGTITWYDILAEEFYEAFAETDVDKQIEEMTQVAAVAVAIIESLERKKHDIQVGH